MIPRVASTRSSLVAEAHVDRRIRELGARPKVTSNVALVFRGLVLPRSAVVALVLFSFPMLVLHGQEPQQWPQDDDNYADQQPANQAPQYGQAQPNPPPGYGEPGYGYGQQSQPQGYGQQQPLIPQAQGMNAQQLEQLVAPIALYPDPLLAQVLAGSTYPAQISAADQWRRGTGNAPPEQIAAGANAQTNWDPSVKALTAYPQVLAMMDQNLQWTTALGNAYYNQPQDVLETVQVLRQRAQAAGNLESTPQQQVEDSQGSIAVAPAYPETVYVPTYNPWVVYGQPIAPYPYYQPYGIGSVVGAAIQFGAGIAVNAFFGLPFGFLSWGLDWSANAVLFHHDAWCSHSRSVADWGFAHGGPRAWRGGEYAHYRDHDSERYGRGGRLCAVWRPLWQRWLEFISKPARVQSGRRPISNRPSGGSGPGFGRPIPRRVDPRIPGRRASDTYNAAAVRIGPDTTAGGACAVSGRLWEPRRTVCERPAIVSQSSAAAFKLWPAVRVRIRVQSASAGKLRRRPRFCSAAHTCAGLWPGGIQPAAGEWVCRIVPPAEPFKRRNPSLRGWAQQLP